jgi:hypothetical protein
MQLPARSPCRWPCILIAQGDARTSYKSDLRRLLRTRARARCTLENNHEQPRIQAPR